MGEVDADKFKVLTSQPGKLRNMILESVEWLHKKKGPTFDLQKAPFVTWDERLVTLRVNNKNTGFN